MANNFPSTDVSHKRYEVWFNHDEHSRFQEATNKKDLDAIIQGLVDSGATDIEVHEVSESRKKVAHKVPEPSEGSQAHVRALEAQNG